MRATYENTYPSRPGQRHAEASDLEIPPGMPPRTLETDLGNEQPFVLENVGQDGVFEYRQPGENGISLLVFND